MIEMIKILFYVKEKWVLKKSHNAKLSEGVAVE